MIIVTGFFNAYEQGLMRIPYDAGPILIGLKNTIYIDKWIIAQFVNQYVIFFANYLEKLNLIQSTNTNFSNDIDQYVNN